MNKLKQLKEGEIFGSISEISRNDFLAEVTEASKNYPVLVYLYQTRYPHNPSNSNVNALFLVL